MIFAPQLYIEVLRMCAKFEGNRMKFNFHPRATTAQKTSGSCQGHNFFSSRQILFIFELSLCIDVIYVCAKFQVDRISLTRVIERTDRRTDRRTDTYDGSIS